MLLHTHAPARTPTFYTRRTHARRALSNNNIVPGIPSGSSIVRDKLIVFLVFSFHFPWFSLCVLCVSPGRNASSASREFRFSSETASVDVMCTLLNSLCRKSVVFFFFFASPKETGKKQQRYRYRDLPKVRPH